MDTVTPGEARRLALTAQGFGDPRPTGRVDRRHVHRVLDRVGLFQIDSVNVLVRSHYLPLFARLGPYDRSLLDRLAYHGELFEYWGHAASLIPMRLHPLLRWKMARVARGESFGDLARWAEKNKAYVDAVFEEVAVCAPLAASELSDPGARSGPWWGWGQGKLALEWLFACGRLSATRRPTFEREYDLTEHVIPPDVLALPTPSEEEAARALITIAARSLGIGTAHDLLDYWRLSYSTFRHLLPELVEDGVLDAVRVDGWDKPAYRAAGAKAGRRTSNGLLSPFDSMMWRRERIERIFGFSYILEIYIPAPKRMFGYYVLPFLMGDRIVARVDVKADRRESTLLVPAAFSELATDTAEVLDALGRELRSLATWLGLEKVSVGTRGDLADKLPRAIPA
jgi:uncharacterized protein YcaQ